MTKKTQQRSSLAVTLSWRRPARFASSSCLANTARLEISPIAVIPMAHRHLSWNHIPEVSCGFTTLCVLRLRQNIKQFQEIFFYILTAKYQQFQEILFYILTVKYQQFQEIFSYISFYTRNFSLSWNLLGQGTTVFAGGRESETPTVACSEFVQLPGGRRHRR